jgi:hypothetical protein
MKNAAVVLILILSLSRAIAAQVNNSERNAARIWEEAIAAKGGRERLYAVRNLVVTSSGSYKALRFTIHPGRKVKSKSLKSSGLYREELFVFPLKYWSWEDYRPAVFGLWIHVYDYSRKIKYVITDGEPTHPVEPIEEKEMKARGLIFVQLMYLLESNWVRPRPVSVRSERTVDVLQIEVDGQQYDFAIDRKTKLVTSLTSYSEDKGKTYENVVKFSDYNDVNGIMMPLTVEMDDGHKERSDIAINADYDENIFNRAPSIDAGSHAWMKVKLP